MSKNKYIALMVNGRTVRTYPNPDKDPTAKAAALKDLKMFRPRLGGGDFAYAAVVEQICEEDPKT